ncbi:MAG: FAD-dependent oxidoreductase, partial [Salinispira sp.]
MDKSVVIIGAGIGGLAAALYCAASGCKVDVFDKREQAGGKA